MAVLNEKQISLLVEGKNFAALATTTADGSPQVNPMWVGWDGECIVMNTAVGRAKEKQIRRSPKVAITVWNAENPYEHFAVNGTAELSLDGAEQQIDDFAQKYIGQSPYPWRSPGEQRINIRVRPEQVHAQNT